MARGKCRALWAMHSYLWLTSCLLLGGTTRHRLDGEAHLCTWSFGGV